MRNIRNFGFQQWRFIVLSLAIVGLALLLVTMGRSVREHVQSLESAPHDNLQWSLSQLDVEYARLLQAITQAMRSPEEDLAPLRRRFDLFYSRSETVTSLRSSIYIAPDATLVALLDTLQNQTISLATVVDQPDEDLRRDLSNLLLQTQNREAFLQMLSSRSIALFAKASDDRRAILSTLLIQIAIVVLLLAISFILVVILLYRSVREARATQATLANVSARLQSTIKGSLDAVIVSDQNGVILDYNGAAEHVFGYERDEVMGKLALHYLIPENNRSFTRSEILQHLKTAVRPDLGSETPLVGKGHLQLTGLKKGGKAFPIEVSIASVDDGEQSIYISFVRDISEQLAAKELLLKSRDDALRVAKAKSDFIAVMSHEMRTPLNGVISAHEVLSTTSFTAHQSKFFSIARSSASHLLSHVNDVLDIVSLDAFAEVRQNTFSPLDTIKEVIENAQPLAQARGNSITADFTGADTGLYLGDERRFRRILINLLGNAIKFTKNGRIQIDFGIYPQKSGIVCLELHVTDSGRGIPSDKLKEIFNDFVRLDTGYDRETDGTGLGLSITQRMVQSLGGEIGVESEVDVGSTFWVKLPFAHCPSPAPSQNPQDQRTPVLISRDPKQLRALLVEDNAINRTLMLAFLEDVGLQIETAENGETGVKAANASKYDYIFMDISMPVLDGIAATKALRANEKGASCGAKIIGFTAHSSQESLEECLAVGMDDVLVKPVNRADILAVLGLQSRVIEPSLPLEDGLLDLQQIESIKDILGPERFSKTCVRFRAELEKEFQILMTEMKNEPSTNPSKERVAQIHKLAGLSASMGARALHQKLEKVQSVAQTNNLDSLQAALEDTANCLEHTLNAAAYCDVLIEKTEVVERTR